MDKRVYIIIIIVAIVAGIIGIFFGKAIYSERTQEYLSENEINEIFSNQFQTIIQQSPSSIRSPPEGSACDEDGIQFSTDCLDGLQDYINYLRNWGIPDAPITDYVLCLLYSEWLYNNCPDFDASEYWCYNEWCLDYYGPGNEYI